MKIKWVKRGIRVMWVAPLLLAVGFGMLVLTWAYRSKTTLQGQLQLPGLSQTVEIRRDASDVTHVMAQNEADAWFSMGWLHASERGWQLEFNRRVVRGTLSEVFGPATLNADKTLRVLGIHAAAQAQYNGLPAETQQVLQAYAAGINAYWATTDRLATPEFAILGVDPKPEARQGAYWTPVDSVGWSLIMALDLGGNWANEAVRAQLASRLDTEAIWQLMPPYPGEKPATSTDFAQMYKRLGIFGEAQLSSKITPNATDAGHAVAQWVEQLGQVRGLGSNNWVVSGQRTQSGLPLLANDPHLGLTAPAIWYFAHIQAADTLGTATPLNVIGATLPGLPFVVLGHTDGVAWGFTNTGPDVQDLYLEQLDPNDGQRYRLPKPADAEAAFATIATRQERIRVKGEDDVLFTARSTRHGPIVSDLDQYAWLDRKHFVLALRWAALDADNATVEAGMQSNRAQNVEDLIRAYRSHHSPMQNVVMADTAGRIAYKAVGRVPVRAPDNDLRGVAPAPGWEPRFDWQGWIPFEDTPQDDGRQGWLATANQRIHDPSYPYFLTQDWVVPYRKDRIDALIAKTPLHTVRSFAAIQNDVVSLEARQWLPILRNIQSAHPMSPAAFALFKDWNGQMQADAAAPLVFNAWLAQLGQAVIQWRLGHDLYARVASGKRQFRPGLLEIVRANDVGWCGESGCEPLINAAWDAALVSLSERYGPDVSLWRWGEAHPAISEHKPFHKVWPLKRFFDVSVPSGGDGFTVNVGQYKLDDPDQAFANRHAASLRAIYDLSNLDRSVFIYQTGQSGNVLSNRYRDMSQEWAQGRYRALRMKPKTTVSTLKLEPAPQQ